MRAVATPSAQSGTEGSLDSAIARDAVLIMKKRTMNVDKRWEQLDRRIRYMFAWAIRLIVVIAILRLALFGDLDAGLLRHLGEWVGLERLGRMFG